MTTHPQISDDGCIVTVHIPITFTKRGGRKLILAPDGAELAPSRPRVDNTLIRAIARAHRWKRMLESGKYTSLAELAEAEKTGKSYLSRVLRLNLLAPEIIEAILDGRQVSGLQLKTLLKPFPIEWRGQLKKFGI
ncbi:MAG: hypothetical protein HQ503_14720 [Rhodospirillales bacterium]|nr:hypothetical protein [Rhodospirillales bacterium]